MTAPASSARQIAALAGSLYTIGLLFLIIPPLEVLVSVVGGTPDPATARWRFGAIGIVSTQLPLMLLGVVLILTAAHLKAHRWVARTMGVLSAVGAVVMLAATALLALDALEVRASVVEQLVRSYDITVIKTLFATLMSAVAGVLLAIASFKLVSGKRAGENQQATDAKGGIVGRRRTNVAEAGPRT